MRCLLVILALCGVVYGGTIASNVEINQQTQKQSLVPAFSESETHPQTYFSGQDARLPATQYYYPSYPEYSSTGYSEKGYDSSYFVPAVAPVQRNSYWTSDFMMSLVPVAGAILSYGTNIASYVVHVLLLIFLGATFTTLVCTFTPICSISFLGSGLTKAQVRDQVAELARTYITPESVNAATVVVTKAIDKYAAMQRDAHMKAKKEETPQEDGELHIR